MLDSLNRGKRYVALLAILAGLLLIPTPTPAEPKLGKQDSEIARLVCAYLKRLHLSKPELNAEKSQRLFKHFLKDLDPAKLYFTKSDIEGFKKSETELGEQLNDGDLSFAYKVYDRFIQRVEERQKLIEELVNAKHDYEVKEYLDTDYDNPDYGYASSDNDVRERWRKRIKFDLLTQKVAEKPLPDDEAKKKVLNRYKGALKRWQQFDGYDLLELYLTELTTSLDPHSTYMSPTTLEDFEISMRLNLEGIGAVLRSEDGTTTVVEVVPGGAAGKDGRLKPKDKIVGVAQGDGKYVDAVNMKLQDVVKMIRGKSGTQVQLKVVPTGKLEPVVIELTRKKVELTSQAARGDIVEDGKKSDGTPYQIGVIDLPSFYHESGTKAGRSATEDVHKLLKDFTEKKVDVVVLDLRHNGGGSLEEAISLTSLFTGKGPVVQVKGSTGGAESLDEPTSNMAYSGPLVVLTSRFSASASEILAGAIQDYGRGLIVGDKSTYGKGTVQQVIDLSRFRVDGAKLGALKVTIRQFYRADGDSTQARGVLSDVVIPSLTEHLGGLEKDQEFALAFDKVDEVKHENQHLITPELKKKLQETSDSRVKDSTDFKRLDKDIEIFKERKARKKMPLNEKELRDLLKKEDSEKIEQKIDEATPKETPSGGDAYKFKKDSYINKEVLKIVEDFIVEGKKVASR